MKFTTDVSKRCEEMLKIFATKNNIDVGIEHAVEVGKSQVRFGDCRSMRPVETYIIKWDEARSLSEVCTNIFVDLTRKWNLDGYNMYKAFEIENVIFNYPATIVLWEDGTKTVVKCQEGDEYSKETGLALCFAKKALGNQGNFNEVFKKWIPEEKDAADITLELNFDKTTKGAAALKLAEDIANLFNKHRRGGIIL